MAAVVKASTAKKWLHEAISAKNQGSRAHNLTLEEQILGYIKKGPLPEVMQKNIEERNKTSAFRAKGFVAIRKLISDLSKTEDKARVLIGLLDVFHRPGKVHFLSELMGSSPSCLAKVEASYQELSSLVIADCEKWLTACSSVSTISSYTDAKQESVVRALLCGLSVVVQDFTSRDSDFIHSSGLIPLLSMGACSPNNTIRSLCQKWAEIIFHRCCIRQEITTRKEGMVPSSRRRPSLPSSGLVDALEVSQESTDALLPSLMEIFCSKIVLAAEQNISTPSAYPPMALNSEESQKRYWILDQQVLCDATEAGFVCTNVTPIPVNHSMGLWVWRPTGISNGTILCKCGVLSQLENPKPWSSLILSMKDGHFTFTCADGRTLDGFTLTAKHAMTQVIFLYFYCLS